MLALIVAVTVMIPIFSDIEAQILYNKNNYGNIAYASEYVAGMDDLDIVVDRSAGMVSIGGQNMAMPYGDVFTIVAGEDFMVEVIGGGGLSITSMWRSNHAYGERLFEARKAYDLDTVTITSTSAVITVVMVDDNASGQNVYTYNTGSDRVFYMSTSGPYGYFGSEALRQGVSVNDPYGTLGVINGPGVQGNLSTDIQYGPMGVWTAGDSGLSVRIYVQKMQIAAPAFLEWSMDQMPATITGTVTDHGEYKTIKVDRITYKDEVFGNEDDIDATGYYLIAPLSYYAGDIEHAGTMMAILWIIPVLVLIGLAVVIVDRIRTREGMR